MDQYVVFLSLAAVFGLFMAWGIGANDVTNPAARHDQTSPLYGMPILNVDSARTVFVIKRSLNPGFAGIQNPLYFQNNTRMVFGDAKIVVTDLVNELEQS